MFVDEMQNILKLKDKNFPFVLTMLGSGSLVLSGVKNIILSTPTELKVRVKGQIVQVSGEELNIRQMGGGDVYLSGEILSVEIEKK